MLKYSLQLEHVAVGYVVVVVVVVGVLLLRLLRDAEEHCVLLYSVVVLL